MPRRAGFFWRILLIYVEFACFINGGGSGDALGTLWDALGRSGDTLGRSGTLGVVPGRSGKFWGRSGDTLGFWVALGTLENGLG